MFQMIGKEYKFGAWAPLNKGILKTNENALQLIKLTCELIEIQSLAFSQKNISDFAIKIWKVYEKKYSNKLKCNQNLM